MNQSWPPHMVRFDGQREAEVTHSPHDLGTNIQSEEGRERQHTFAIEVDGLSLAVAHADDREQMAKKTEEKVISDSSQEAYWVSERLTGCGRAGRDDVEI